MGVFVYFEFCVLGRPHSAQGGARGVRNWKAKVRASALAQWPAGNPPDAGHIEIAIDYYALGEGPDVDNIIKPIQDALIGVAFVDDAQVAKTGCERRDLDGHFRVRGMAPVLAEAFSTGEEFVHVRLTTWTDDGRLR